MNLQTLQLLLNLPIALGQLRAIEVEQGQRLLECKQMLSSPVALQAFGDVLSTGMDAHILHRGQHPPVTLSSHDGVQNFLPRLANHVGR